MIWVLSTGGNVTFIDYCLSCLTVENLPLFNLALMIPMTPWGSLDNQARRGDSWGGGGMLLSPKEWVQDASCFKSGRTTAAREEKPWLENRGREERCMVAGGGGWLRDYARGGSKWGNSPAQPRGLKGSFWQVTDLWSEGMHPRASKEECLALLPGQHLRGPRPQLDQQDRHSVAASGKAQKFNH